jgi:hypothetical protein
MVAPAIPTLITIGGTAARTLAKRLGPAATKKALNKLTTVAKGGSKKPTKKQITDILRVADQEKKAGLLNKTAKKETDIHKPSPTHSTGRGGHKQLSGISKRDVKIGKGLGKTQRTIQSGVGAAPRPKGKDVPTPPPVIHTPSKIAPKPKLKPEQKKKKQDTSTYYKATRGPTGAPRRGLASGTPDDHNVKVNLSVLEKKRGGRVGCGVAKRGFGAVRKR